MNQQQMVMQEPQQPSQHVSTMSQSQFKLNIAAGRYKSIDPQNCLSCGEFELSHVQNKNLIGLHAKNGSSVEFSRKSRILSIAPQDILTDVSCV